MFEARIVNPPDSGAAGGLGYSKFGNNAQSGNTTSIQLATAESFAEADILGLRIIITAGDGTISRILEVTFAVRGAVSR